ncbi:septal ring lytic transglycosylase RlpA family protein [Pontibacter anaerobius]|uniref:Probable endolytic peptidoglycan transglycosylase RlpA n=1 Tax=Pontibacter anaerobius TaxID=2993940 RepID=A0ABT3RGM1_9BACT|nr:septal ring lytic transglycosylase RlpA family protein [Pontibacter anaerobius]MCX2740641.1 septal ring lytic transglycosylase RlpA family protein [Pontibacter anaerobius]
MLTFLPTSPFPILSRAAKSTLAAATVALCLSSCATTAPGFGEKGYVEEGKASYYGRKFQGRKMANGERYRRNKLTAAHKKLPFGTQVEVTNLQNNKSVRVEITDRGPFVRGRIVDLSEAAARRVNMINSGVAPVRLEVVKPSKVK